MKHFLDAVQSVLPFGVEASPLAANSVPPVGAIASKAGGLANYRKVTGLLVRPADKVPQKA